MSRPQHVGDKDNNRADHIWLERLSDWKCILCGAVTFKPPPGAPTPPRWMPAHYEAVTAQDRELEPYKG